MNNVLKKVSALFLIILMISSVSFNVISYGVDLLSNIKNETIENITKLFTNNNTSSSTYDLMITNRNNSNQAYQAKSVAKNINKGDSSDYDVLLTQDADGQYYYCMEKGGALVLYANGGATLREFYYDATPYKNITKEQTLVLTYLNAPEVTEILGISLNSNNNRQKLIQYYIWKTGINQGNSVSVPSAYANVISTLQKCVNGKITIGKDVLNINDGTLTINGVKYEIDSFSAYKYTSKLIYRIDNGKGYIESNYTGCGQEIFTFNSKLKKENEPNIKLHKVDSITKAAISGVKFKIVESSPYVNEDEYLVTDTNGNIDLSEYLKNEGDWIELEEVEAPSGYTIVPENSIHIEVVKENGKLKLTGTAIWGDEVIELESSEDLTIEFENKKEDTPPVKLHKIDSTTKKAISGVKFKIVESSPYVNEDEYLVTDTNGNIDLSEYLKDEGDWVELEEIEAPSGYIIVPENSIHIEVVKENGELKLKGTAIWGDEVIELESSKDLTIEFENKRKDTPQIQIYKHDQNGNAVPGVEFTIEEYSKELTLSSNKLTVQSNGYTNIVNVEGMENGKTYKFILKENNVPNGYKKIDSDITLTITIDEEGNILWTITWTEDGRTITKSGNGNLILLDIENKKENTDLELQLLKIDADNNKPLNGAIFEVSGYISGTLTSGENGTNGYTNALNLGKLEPGKVYEIKIKETKAPSNEYKDPSKLPEIVIQITVNEDGTINEPKIISNNNQGVSVKLDITNNIILVTVSNTKEIANQAYPLLMYIKGNVFLDGIEGKESKLDGYFNPENNSDKGLEGIKVEIYDETTNALAILATREALTPENNDIEFDTSSVDWEALEKYGKATMYTDKNGFFEFYGLNPSHTYYLMFTYNGMRYAEIKATTETGMNISKYDVSKENASKATEINRESKIVEVFSEIGTYPYNYYSLSKGGYNIAYNQDDVEEAIKNGLSKCSNNYETLYSDLSKYIDENLAYFIQDTQVNAKISGLGNILSKAEDKVKEYNKGIKENAGKFVYPVVEYHGSPNVDQVEFYKDYGYTIERFYADPITTTINGHTEIVGYTEPYWHVVGKGSVGTLSYDERADGEWNNVKDTYIQKDQSLMEMLSNKIRESNGEVRYVSNIIGHWTELKDGYESQTIAGVEWAIFDLKNQQYLGDWNSKYQSVTYKDSYKKLVEYLKLFNEDINTNLPCANLGVQYRSTFDMALYNDVQKAEVIVNGVPGEYVYDKRAANGNAFCFGVNESDLRTYYKNLTDGNIEELRKLKYNNSINSTDVYYNDYRSSDIHYLSEVQKTNNGIGIAGGYDDKDNAIYLTYKIKLINQSSVKGTITEIVDYYSKDFDIVKVYDDNNKEYEFSNESIYKERGAKQLPDAKYSVAYIKVNNMELSNNESQCLYLVLKMKDIPNTLTEEILNSEEGYKTVNLVEINGYKTTNGYIDIDSIPGDIIEKSNEDGTSRFEKGKYEDDESKSPTLIFKNPNPEGRTISGVVFEDATTGEWVTTQTRQSTANHQYDEKDTLIQGATVQLIQILANGTEKISSQTITTSEGTYKFIHVRPGNYVLRFAYGNTDMTVLTSKNKIDDEGTTLNIINNKSYNGESFENTEKKTNTTLGAEGYWYTDSDINTNSRYSDAIDNKERRDTVTENFTKIKNDKAEILNSYKDSKVNRTLVNELKLQSYMYATTDTMKLEMEYVGSKNEDTNGTTTTAKENGNYTYEYNITNVDFGIVERSRAKLDITKKVSYISLVDSTGKEITGGTYEDWKAGKIKHVKWIPEANGFVGMEIDTELLSGATLKITYDITVKDNSEAGNEISNIEVIDYVTNNLNYSTEYANNEGKENSTYGWETVTTDKLIKEGYVNNKSVLSNEETNKIDLSTYQTILKATFKPGETKRLTLEKNLSSEEDSNFNYDNKVEIVSSNNTKGRGDYSSIYGNLDPVTFTSRQGNLYWDYIQGTTSSTDNDTETVTESSGFNAIRVAEDDSASAERVEISVPTGATGIIIPGEYYIFGLTLSISLVIGAILIKKYKELG